MKLNDELLKQTAAQINEMQNAMREAAKQIEGSQEYIEKQMELFKDNKGLKEAQKMIMQQREMVANDFFKNHQHTIDTVTKNILNESTKKMIADTLKASQELEGISQELKDKAAQILKQYNIQITSPQKSGDSE